MSSREKAFTTVGGVPVHYARSPVAAYGTKGKAHTFHSTRSFHQKLDACFNELWRLNSHGRAEVVVSAGAQVSKSGQHGHGRAFDVDSIFWAGKTLVTKKFPDYPQFYLSVEAVLRKHFGVVLNYHYNAAHRDHFHIDDGSRVGFRTVRSVTLFMQSVCYYMFGLRFRGNVDGKYGSGTRTAMEEVYRQMGIPLPLNSPAHWTRFLDQVAGWSEITMPPMMIYGAVDRLRFNGSTLTWIRGGRPMKSYPAVSGRSGFQSGAHQSLKNKGPLPQGKWFVRQSEYQKMPSRSWIEELAAELGRTAWPGGVSAWGRNRIWLHPKPGTKTYERSGFSIHGGDSPGSAGCIDLTNSMPAFVQEFRKTGKDLELEVIYR